MIFVLPLSLLSAVVSFSPHFFPQHTLRTLTVYSISRILGWDGMGSRAVTRVWVYTILYCILYCTVCMYRKYSAWKRASETWGRRRGKGGRDIPYIVEYYCNTSCHMPHSTYSAHTIHTIILSRTRPNRSPKRSTTSLPLPIPSPSSCTEGRQKAFPCGVLLSRCMVCHVPIVLYRT